MLQQLKMKIWPGRKMIICTLAFCLISIFSTSVFAQSKNEIIHGSFFVAFGRFANSDELKYWLQNVGNRTIQQMVFLHKDHIKNSQSEREQIVKRSYMDAFGWEPSTDELRYCAGQNKTYSELMTSHVNNWLNVYPERKELVIKQSYYKVFGRNATAAELKYWMAQPTYTFVQLVAMHATCKLKNQNNSSVTIIRPNITSNGISTALFSELAIVGVVAAGGSNVIAPRGGNVVAANGTNVIAPGGNR